MSATNPETHQVVQIDVENSVQAQRYRCPQGHAAWEPTNGGIWCRSCSRMHSIEDPHYHAVHDQVTGEEIPWAQIQLVGDW